MRKSVSHFFKSQVEVIVIVKYPFSGQWSIGLVVDTDVQYIAGSTKA